MRIFRITPITIVLLAVFVSVHGQNRCFTSAEAARTASTVKTPIQAANIKDIRKELVAMARAYQKLNATILEDFAKNSARVPELNALAETSLLRVCQIVKESGWQNRAALKDEAFDAFTYVITTGKAIDAQRELLPVLIEASKIGEIRKPMLAELVDKIRLGSGYGQIFGTQATRNGDVIYILPLANEAKVDEWRKAYELPPLADEIRVLEARYTLPVLRSQRLSGQMPAPKSGSDVSSLGISNDDADIKIETKIVNLNVRVFTPDLKTPYGVNLTKDDFTIIEDGREQETAFFSSESAPFDLVLVLDFSGSTVDKRSLIKKAAKRFVEVARPDDRVSVVVFANEVKVASELTADKKALYDAIDKVKTEGGSAIWDALKFTYENILKEKTPGHRSAIVFMTDGFDNSSKSTYADAMELVRHGDTTLFSVYINTMDIKPSEKDLWGRFGAKLEASLSLLAEESGGQFYRAKDLKDLNGIYEQVVSDIGRIYSLGYEPKNEQRDGGWRAVGIKLKNGAALIVKTRRGYYAN